MFVTVGLLFAATQGCPQEAGTLQGTWDCRRAERMAAVGPIKGNRSHPAAFSSKPLNSTCVAAANRRKPLASATCYSADARSRTSEISLDLTPSPVDLPDSQLYDAACLVRSRVGL